MEVHNPIVRAFILTQVSAKRMVSIILPAFRVWDGNREDILTND